MDELDLLRGSDGPAKRPPWALLTVVVVVALLALVGAGWVASSVISGSDRPAPVAAPAPTTSAPATTTPVATVPASATVLPSTSPPVPTSAVPTVTVPAVPVQSAATVVAPRPRPTTPGPTPAPTPKPAPKPTASTPAPGTLVQVPDVIGLRVRGATAVLQAAGFRVGVLGGVLTPNRDQRRVTAQRPTPGTLLRTGSVVILVSDSV